MVLCSVWVEPVSKPFSLKYREFTGKFCILGKNLSISAAQPNENAKLSTKFPKNVTGNFNYGTGK